MECLKKIAEIEKKNGKKTTLSKFNKFEADVKKTTKKVDKLVAKIAKVVEPKVKKPSPFIKPETLAYRNGMALAEKLGIGDKWTAGVISSLMLKSTQAQRETLVKFFSSKEVAILIK